MRLHFITPRLGWLAACGLTFGLGWWIGHTRRDVPAGGEVVELSHPQLMPPAPPSLRKTVASGTLAKPKAAEGLPDLAGLSPAETKKVLESLSDAREREAAIRAHLATLPVEEWPRWIRQCTPNINELDDTDLENVSGHLATINAAMSAIVSLDPEGYLRAAGHPRTSGLFDGMDINFLISAWGKRQPAEAAHFLSGQLASDSPLKGLESNDVTQRLAAVWARQDGPAAFAWASSLPENHRGRAQRNALAAYAQADFAGAEQWAATLPDTHKKAAQHAIFEVLVKADPVRAAERWDTLPPTPGVNDASAGHDFAKNIAENWAQQDPKAALAWAGTQTGKAGREAIAAVAETWAAADFDTAWQGLEAAGALSSSISTLVHQAPENRLSELASEAEKIADTAARAEASAAMMRVWTHKNPEAASAWMAAQPEGEIRDQAISAFVRWADVRDPEAGLIWAATMTDSARRQEAMRHIIEQLGERAPAEAGPWLEQNTTLPAAERIKLQQMLQQGR